MAINTLLINGTAAYNSLVILKITISTWTSDEETINISYLTHFNFDNRPLPLPFILEQKCGRRGLIDLTFSDLDTRRAHFLKCHCNFGL